MLPYPGPVSPTTHLHKTGGRTWGSRILGLGSLKSGRGSEMCLVGSKRVGRGIEREREWTTVEGEIVMCP